MVHVLSKACAFPLLYIHINVYYYVLVLLSIFADLRSNINSRTPKELFFYSEPRLDSLEYLKVGSDRIILHYNNRADLCYYQEFDFKPIDRVKIKVII